MKGVGYRVPSAQGPGTTRHEAELHPITRGQSPTCRFRIQPQSDVTRDGGQEPRMNAKAGRITKAESKTMKMQNRSNGPVTQPRGQLSMAGFFKLLGAPLHNTRWSWGAVRPKDGTVFLRVWKDRVEVRNGTRYVEITPPPQRDVRRHPGKSERHRHVDLVRAGARCFLIVCAAVDARDTPRTIGEFEQDVVFPGGRTELREGAWWIEMLDGVPVHEAGAAQGNV